MSRLIIGIGLMGVVAVLSFLAGFAFCHWGYQQQSKQRLNSERENMWN